MANPTIHQSSFDFSKRYELYISYGLLNIDTIARFASIDDAQTHTIKAHWDFAAVYDLLTDNIVSFCDKAARGEWVHV